MALLRIGRFTSLRAGHERDRHEPGDRDGEGEAASRWRPIEGSKPVSGSRCGPRRPGTPGTGPSSTSSGGAPTAELLVSELVTNAVCHARTGVELTVTVDDHRLCVEVHDEGGEPEVAHPAPTTTGGRGLMIVERLAEQWGWAETGGDKTVWFELPVHGRTGV